MAAPPSSSGFLTPVEAARAGWRLALSGRKGVGGLESQGRRGGPRTWRESCRGGKSLPKRRYKPPDGLFHDPLESYLENARWPLADGQQNGKLPPRQRMGAYYMRPRPYTREPRPPGAYTADKTQTARRAMASCIIAEESGA